MRLWAIFFVACQASGLFAGSQVFLWYTVECTIECSFNILNTSLHLFYFVSRFLRTLVFSEDAQAVILCSPFEIQRLSMFARPG